MSIVWTLVIIACAVIGVAVANAVWRPLRWPAYAFAAWLSLLLAAWPLSATGALWKEIRIGWYITFAMLSAAVVVIFYGFAIRLLLHAARALIRRLR